MLLLMPSRYYVHQVDNDSLTQLPTDSTVSLRLVHTLVVMYFLYSHFQVTIKTTVHQMVRTYLVL